MSAEELERRATIALSAIKRAYGTPDDAHGGTLFVSHHLQELSDDYWQEHCGTSQPTPDQVLAILTLRSDEEVDEEEDEEEFDLLDFSLPGDVTDYVISVSFDEDGQVEAITMES